MDLKKAIDILGVSKEYSDDDLQKAYKAYAKKYHPDNDKTGDEEKFIEVKEAFEYLENYNGDENVDSPNNIQSEETKKCSKCSGTGQMYKKVRSSGKLKLTKVKCDLCRGRGVILK